MEFGPGAGQFRIHRDSHVPTAPGSFSQFDFDLVPKNLNPASVSSPDLDTSIGSRNIDGVYYNDVGDLPALLEGASGVVKTPDNL